jgi:PIN domain nuclease of toxin-antitoxin system
MARKDAIFRRQRDTLSPRAVRLGKPFREWIVGAAPNSAFEILPLSVEVSAEANDLPGAFDTGDPFDQIIVATARIFDLTLVACDSAIRNYPHVKKLVYRRHGDVIS